MLDSKIESILFIAARPLPLKKLAELVEGSRDEVNAALDRIAGRYNVAGSGIRLLRVADSVQLATSPEHSGLVQDYLKDETTGELTKPSLETLTIIAYRGPISKAELEQVRGVNCSLIIRNLMMRGLIEASGDPGDIMTTFNVTMDFIRFLGVSSIEELPDYDALRSHENVARVLEAKKGKGGEEAALEEGSESA
jgi:segregation and condensation protein B